MTYGIENQPGNIMNIEALHQRRAVGFNCLDADLKLKGDLLGAFTLGDHLQDFSLARRQRLHR